MVIKESQFTESALMLLDQLNPLTEEDHISAYPATMVPIRHVSRVNQDLIRLESFMEYSQANGIFDGGKAIAKVCEANECPIDNIGFMVSESNLYADEEIWDTMKQIQEANFPVYLIAESDDSVYSVKLREAFVMDEGMDYFEECDNLKNYCFNSIFSEAGMVQDTKATIAKKLAAVRKMISAQMEKINNAAGANKALLNKQLAKLKAMANTLKNRLVDAKNNAVARFN